MRCLFVIDNNMACKNKKKWEARYPKQDSFRKEESIRLSGSLHLFVTVV